MSDNTTQNDHQSYMKQQSMKSRARRNFFLFTLIPFILLNTIIFFAVTTMPEFTLEINSNPDFKTVGITITQTSIYPLKSFVVKLDDKEIPMEMHKEGLKTIYEAVVSSNGGLSVEAINLNGMRKIVYDQIDSIDTTPPLILEPEETEDSKVSLTLEDDQSGIDFDKLYGIDANGNNIRPESVNKEDSSVIFPYDTDSLEIHVVDKVGNQSVANFSRVDRHPKRETESASNEDDTTDSDHSKAADGKKSSENSSHTENTKARNESTARSTTSAKSSQTKKSSTSASSAKDSSSKTSKSSSKSTSAGTKSSTSASQKSGSAKSSASASQKSGSAKNTTSASQKSSSSKDQSSTASSKSGSGSSSKASQSKTAEESKSSEKATGKTATHGPGETAQ